MECVAFSTRLGAMAIALENDRVSALVFGQRDVSQAERALGKVLQKIISGEGDNGRQPIIVDELVERLQAFAEGQPTDFSDLQIDDDYATTFQRRVLQACRKIPWGETVTYGQLASRVGRPAAARAVGSVMAGNRVPLIVPCHRVVPASGGLGGFSAPQGVKMKRRLLDAEKLCLVA